MELLITRQELQTYKTRQKAPCKCFYCKKIFYVCKNLVQRALKGTKVVSYCSRQCAFRAKVTRKLLICENCKNEFSKRRYDIKKTKHHFCSQHCAGKYNSQHKTTGDRRSKLERWLECQLHILYPDLNIIYNDRKTILAELDIYIPNLKLAFELNGIFHYEQIFKTTLLSDVQQRDKNKMINCFKIGIELCVIDTTSVRYFKPDKAKKFLDIITNIIDVRLKMEPSEGTAPSSEIYKIPASL